jgi:hypothetical protein
MRVVLSLPLTSWYPISRSREDAGLLSIRPTSMKFAVQEGRNCASLFKLGILVEDQAIARWSLEAERRVGPSARRPLWDRDQRV